MIKGKTLLASCLSGSMLAIWAVTPTAFAKPPIPPAGTVTLMQFQDMHGHLAPHAEIFPDGRMDPNSGGIAKVTTLIKQVRAEDPNALLLGVGEPAPFVHFTQFMHARRNLFLKLAQPRRCLLDLPAGFTGGQPFERRLDVTHQAVAFTERKESKGFQSSPDYVMAGVVPEHG